MFVSALLALCSVACGAGALPHDVSDASLSSQRLAVLLFMSVLQISRPILQYFSMCV